MKTEMLVMDGATVERAVDARFSGWNRVEVPAAIEDESGQLNSCWPSLHPLDEAERERFKLPEGTQTLEQVKAEIGSGPFASEYMCRPGEGGTTFFEDLTEAKHGYWFKEGSAYQQLIDAPTKSNTMSTWWRANT